MSKRKAITERMKIDALLYRAFKQDAPITCARCGGVLVPAPDCIIQWDHGHPLGLGGPHHFTNLQPLHVDCHAAKTRGTGATTANSDIGKIAKERRIVRTGKMAVKKRTVLCFEGEEYELKQPHFKRPFPKGRKLQSRGFEKRKPA